MWGAWVLYLFIFIFLPPIYSLFPILIHNCLYLLLLIFEKRAFHVIFVLREWKIEIPFNVSIVVTLAVDYKH